MLLGAAAAAPFARLAAPAIAQQQEIVWWAPNWGQARAEELKRRFEAETPGQRIKLEITVADGLQNRALAAIRSGSPPELMEIQSGWNVPYAASGGLMALDEVVTANNIALNDFLPAPLGTARYDNKLMGLPYRCEAHGLIYSKGAFREAGLDPEKPPQDWNEQVDMAKRLTRRTGAGQQMYGMGICGGGEVGNMIFRSMPQIWSNGGSVISDDLRRAVVNEPPAVAAVDFYCSFFTRHNAAPPSTLQNDGLALRRLFVAGTLGMYQSGQFDIPAIRQENANLDIGVGPVPPAPGKPKAAVLGGWNFVVPAQARNRDGAAKLVAFLAKPDVMGFYTDTFPARVSAMELPRFNDPILRPFKEMLPFARATPPLASWVQIVQVYFDNVQRILLREAEPQAAMNDAARAIQRLIDR
jgi:ABC-type glycerol-3-phosphate transport system substrate-binding protein